ncbi:hypothetical protein [uncultured Hymenobacter sp.]|uniref:hypothetical protein n=1 Tax=uncultured Hymenobacter sp. TaxID=170016 RepID=UPI0035CB42D4
MEVILWIYGLIPLGILCVLFGFYVYLFRGIDSTSFRIGLSVFALGFIFTELYVLFDVLTFSQLGTSAWDFINALPGISLLGQPAKTDNDVVSLPFKYFGFLGLISFVLSIVFRRVRVRRNSV